MIKILKLITTLVKELLPNLLQGKPEIIIGVVQRILIPEQIGTKFIAIANMK